MISVRLFQRHLAVQKVIQSSINYDQWPAAIYYPQIQYYAPYNRLYFPAGMLQHPIYSYRVPMFVNFATMGRYVAEQLIAAIYSMQGFIQNSKAGVENCNWIIPHEIHLFPHNRSIYVIQKYHNDE